MKNEITPFSFEGHNVRTLTIDDEPWFVAKDVCYVLEISNTSQAISALDNDEKGICNNDTLGGSQTMSTINESGLYSLILRSRKPEAKRFKKWVTSEVLPSIRKQGAYMTEETIEKVLTDPDFLIKLATNLKKEQQARRLAEAQAIELAEKNAVMKPLADFGNAIAFTEATVSVGDFVKSVDIGMGRNKFFNWLRVNGYLQKDNVPLQRYIDQGLFEVSETIIQRSEGAMIKATTRLTGKGQKYFFDKLKQKK